MNPTMEKRSRFDYVRYDAEATEKQEAAKAKVEELETLIDALPDGRAKSLALTKLEEVYMWIGKAIRDEQIQRNPAESGHVPERTNE